MQQLRRLLASPLRLAPDAVATSAETLQNVDLLRDRMWQAICDKAAFPDFGTQQPWAYGAVATELRQIAEAGTPSLTWAELPAALAGMLELGRQGALSTPIEPPIN